MTPRQGGPPSKAPTKLVVVRNDQSHALMSSEFYSGRLQEVCLERGNHIYLIVLGPRIRVVGVEDRESNWKISTEFDADGTWKPRSLLVPRALLGDGELQQVKSHVMHRSTSGTETTHTAVSLARKLFRAHSSGELNLDPAWYRNTVAKFFTYTVVYVGQAYGRKRRRSAAERIRDGHEHLQKVLAEVHDFHPDTHVGVLMADHAVDAVEIHGFSAPDTWELLAEMSQSMFETFGGPLQDDKTAIDAIEGLLVRYFQPEENTRLKQFPARDLPSLVDKLRAAHITHLGIDFDVTSAHAMILDTKRNRASPEHRFSINITTGKVEVASNTPLSWRA